jgi:hypothetical protein
MMLYIGYNTRNQRIWIGSVGIDTLDILYGCFQYH